jgi:hypothetical protein
MRGLAPLTLLIGSRSLPPSKDPAEVPDPRRAVVLLLPLLPATPDLPLSLGLTGSGACLGSVGGRSWKAHIRHSHETNVNVNDTAITMLGVECHCNQLRHRCQRRWTVMDAYLEWRCSCGLGSGDLIIFDWAWGHILGKRSSLRLYLAPHQHKQGMCMESHLLLWGLDGWCRGLDDPLRDQCFLLPWGQRLLGRHTDTDQHLAC